VEDISAALQADIEHRFAHHSPDAMKIGKHATVRSELRLTAISLCKVVPEGRERALMLTKLEEAMFIANAGIARSKS
jgi:hypothetical protein